MNKIKSFINITVENLKTTIIRFPVVLLFLASVTTTIFMLIHGEYKNEDPFFRYVFSFVVGAFLAVVIQFLIERFKDVKKYRLLLYLINLVLAFVYYHFMTNDRMSDDTGIRFVVIVFSLFAFYLYIPSSKDEFNFGNIAIVHFKSAFTALLYGIVLNLGIFAIIGAIDILLFKLDNKTYAYTADIVFTFFTPVYYLSLLPIFNSKEENDIRKNELSAMYPRFLDILVSYIAVPLISIFTVVLIIYFIKILVTWVWPVGQVGPMVLGYAAVGYFLYILGSNLTNRFTTVYRKLFPIILIPMVLMQMLSVYIRVESYGITESRYYVILFGIFSLVTSIILIFRKNKNPNIIVILSAIFAIMSIMPFVDAFTISRVSQTNRLEEILNRNSMIKNNLIVPNSAISDDDKNEITNISNYLNRMGYLQDLRYFPEQYKSQDAYYRDFDKIYGFYPYYKSYYSEIGPVKYMYAMLDQNAQLDISGYDRYIKVSIYNEGNPTPDVGKFTIDAQEYTIRQSSDNNGDVIVSINDKEGDEVIKASLKSVIDNLLAKASQSKEMFPPEELSVEASNNEMKIRIVINDLNINKENDSKVNISGTILMFIDKK